MKFSVELTCPACGSSSVGRSRRRGIEVITKLIDIYKPFRCARCGHRFWLLFPLKDEPLRGIRIENKRDGADNNGY